VAQQSVIKITSLVFINLVTPKARAKHEPLFNEPAASEVGLLNIQVGLSSSATKCDLNHIFDNYDSGHTTSLQVGSYNI
jgi:hypothetical protein